MTRTLSDETRLVADLETLVAFDTENPPGRETEAVVWLGDRLSAAGFDVAVQQFAPGRANISAALVNGAGPTFAFNTHVDVVPAGAGWSANPFQLRADGDRLYGRGACDAKGSI